MFASEVNKIFLITGNPHVLVCPCCKQKTLVLRDHRLRIMRKMGGETCWIEVPRYRCKNEHPRRYHTALPSFLSFFKHYVTQLIKDTANSLLTKEDIENRQMNYPCDSTLERWRCWIDRNKENIDGHLKSVGSRLPGYGKELLHTVGSLLEKLRDDGMPWLAIVQRVIYNSGEFLAR